MGARLKLTPKQKKRIIADHVDGISNVQIAKKFGVSETTIRRVLKSDPETAKLVEEKKQQNTLDMLAYMDGQKGYAQEVLRNILEALNDPEKLKRANVRDLSTAYGIIVDKFCGAAPKQNDELLSKAKEILNGVASVIE